MSNQSPGGGFEHDLLNRLKLFVAERDADLTAAEAAAAHTSTARRLAPRLAVGGAVAAAAAAAVLALSAGSSSTSQAFAVETEPGSGTLIQINSLEDSAGLEAALAAAGINSQITWLAPGMVCREPHFTPVAGDEGWFIHVGSWHGTTSTPEGDVTVTIGAQQAEEGELPAGNVGVWTFDPAAFSPDETLVVYGSPATYGGNPEGGWLANFSVAEGNVGACVPTPAPAEGS